MKTLNPSSSSPAPGTPSAAGAPSSAPTLARLLNHLILGGLIVGVPLLALQTFSGPATVAIASVILSLWLLHAAVCKRAVIVWTPIHWTLLGLLGVALVQWLPLPVELHPVSFGYSFEGLPVQLDRWTAISQDRHATAAAAAVLAALSVLFFVATNLLQSARQIRQLVKGLTIIGFAMALVAVLDRLSDPSDPLLRGSGAFGLYYYSMGRLVGYMEMIMPLPLAMMLTAVAQRDEWAWYGLAAITLGVGIVLADATGGVFVLVIQLVALVLLLRKRHIRLTEASARKRHVVWIGVGATLIVGMIIGGAVWFGTRSVPNAILSDVQINFPELDRARQDASQADYFSRYYGRAGIWKASLPMIADYPVMGVGLGSYPTAYTRYDPASGLFLVNAAHNDYLQLVCETGLIGALILMLFLWSLVRLCQRAMNDENPFGSAVAVGATVGCLGILAHSLGDFHLQAPGAGLLFLLLIAVLIGVYRLQAHGANASGDGMPN